MKKIPAHTISSPPGRAGLYLFVFEHTFVRVFVVVLLFSFSLQTVERAFASEVPAEGVAAPAITITDSTLETIQDEVAIRASAEAPALEDPGLNADESTSDTPPLVEAAATSTPIVEAETTDEDVIDVPAEETETVEALPTATTTVDEATTTASTTDEIVPTLTVESDQMIQFNKDNCLAVEDGSFYCQVATTTTAEIDRGLVALPDKDGDLEIYIKDGDLLTQLTDNLVDDASPYYDAMSDTIVWHRVIDERYQIIMYDVASGEEEQLTDTSTNNMEPFRLDNIVVWQHWDKDAWQIMVFDGEHIKQLTATVEHNLAPVVRNNLVVWHRVMYGEKTIEVYDLSSGSYMTIRDDEGGTISNPRMVLVYDSEQESGETVTRGYDLVTGEITSFEAPEEPLPEELPEPDATGETKALLSVKSASEEENADDVPSPDFDTGTSTDVIVPATATSTGLTLDLSQATTTATVATETSVPDIPDLVIDSFATTSSPTVIPVSQ